MKIYLLAPLLLLLTFSLKAQEITETNSDKIYELANELYQKSNYDLSLLYTKRGLELAPGYHDIRILQIRNYWALENYPAADEDLNYLLKTAPDYVGLKPLVLQRINRFDNEEQALWYIEKLENIYPGDTGLQIKKAQLYLGIDRQKEARSLAMELFSRPNLTGEDRYAIQILLIRSVTNQVGINYQYIGFSDEYTRNEPWHSVSGEYQHNFGRTATIARVTYSDRSFRNGNLYELEAYPVFNDKLYAFANIGISNGELFPDFRGSLSVFYNFAKVFEAELGGRYQSFNENDLYTGILGLTLYQGKFYFNARAFLGPELNGELVRNYQGNIRYYLHNVDNFLYLRIGSGISPDERVLSTQALDNPLLEAYYGTLGINFSLGVHHIIQIGAGALYEDITLNRQGTQFLSSVGYRYRF
jgi:YaiO family outer membrane protein